MMKQPNKRSNIVVVAPPIYNRFFRGKTTYAMSKVAMTVLVKGLANDLSSTNIKAVTLWPATGIISAATNRIKNTLDPSIDSKLRLPSIFADAILMMAKDPSLKCGATLIDEDYLRSQGVTDFAQYRVDPKSEPPRMMPKVFPDLTVAEENQEAFKIAKL